MKAIRSSWKVAAGCVVALHAFAGCESDGSSSTPATDYYGAGVYDPWYHGTYDYRDDVVPPPPGEPGVIPPRPAHPIALPPAPRPQPLPGIPMRPRPAFRR